MKLQQKLEQAAQFENWSNIPGNRTRMEYYTGVEAGNPSGSTDNIKFLYFEQLDWTSGTYKLSLKQELTYDSADNVLTITATNN